MFGLLTCSSSQSMGQLSYTCFAMSEAESFGEKRNSFVFPLTKMRRKLIISAGTWLDILPFESGPEVYAENKTKTRAEVLELRKSKSKKKTKTKQKPFTILIGSCWAFSKEKKKERSRSYVGAQELLGREARGESIVSSSSSSRTRRARWTEPSDTGTWSGVGGG